MIVLSGTYHKGYLQLDEPIEVSEPVKVIVTFLEKPIPSNSSKKEIRKQFSFDKSRELLKDYKGSLSDAVIEERYQD